MQTSDNLQLKQTLAATLGPAPDSNGAGHFARHISKDSSNSGGTVGKRPQQRGKVRRSDNAGSAAGAAATQTASELEDNVSLRLSSGAASDAANEPGAVAPEQKNLKHGNTIGTPVGNGLRKLSSRLNEDLIRSAGG